MKTEKAISLVMEQLERCVREHNAYDSPHEGYAVILEELDELWDDVKQNHIEAACEEAAQVAACAIRFIIDLSTHPNGL